MTPNSWLPRRAQRWPGAERWYAWEQCSARASDEALEGLPEPQMLVGGQRCQPAPRRPLDEAFPEEKRLVDVLDGVRLLPHGHRQGGQPHRPAPKPPRERRPTAPVRPV